MLELRMLGTVVLTADDDRSVGGVAARSKPLALLAYLCLARPRGFHRRDSLLPLFWPESDQAKARHALRQALWWLRRQLGPESIINRGQEEVGLGGGVRCDVHAFEAALEAGRREEALEVYRGDLLRGVHLSGAPAFERWLDAERERLRRKAVEAAWAEAEAHEAEGDSVSAAHWARRATAIAPHSEAEVRRLIELLARLGDRAGALRVYEEFARSLSEEFDSEPTAATRDLAAALRAEEEAAAEGATARSDAAAPAEDHPPAPAPEPRDGHGPSSAAPPPAPTPRRRFGHASVIAAVIAVAVVLVAVLSPWESVGSAPPDATRIAILPFDYRGSGDLQYLGAGMPDLLSPKLEGAGNLRPVDLRAVFKILDDRNGFAPGPERGRTIARRVDAGSYLVGEVTEVGRRVQIHAALHDASRVSEPIAEATVGGASGEVFELVDRLAKTLIAEWLDDSTRGRARLASRATSSLPALKAYLEGERRYRRGEYRAAVTALDRAVAIDSTFSRAWHRLSLALMWDARSQYARAPAEAAVRHAKRSSGRSRLLMDAYRAYLSHDVRGAEGLFERAFRKYPESLEAAYGLGEVRFHMGPAQGTPAADAQFAFERALALEPNHLPSILHLARITLLRGDESTFLSLANRYESLAPGGGRTLELQALSAVLRGDRVAEDSISRALLSHGLDRSLLTAYRVAIYTGNLDAAERFLDRVPAWGQHRTRNRRALFNAARGRGATGAWEPLQLMFRSWNLVARCQAALSVLGSLPSSYQDDLEALRDTLLSLQPPTGAISLSDSDARGSPRKNPALRLYLLGLVSAWLGDEAAADRFAVALEREARGADAAVDHTDLLRGLRAELRRGRSEPARALQALGAVTPASYGTVHPPLLPNVHWRLLEADVLRSLGRDELALQRYGSLLEDHLFSVALHAPAHLGMAEIHDDLGDREAAVRHYARFLELWSGAEAELQPRVEEVRNRLAQLTGEGS